MALRFFHNPTGNLHFTDLPMLCLLLEAAIFPSSNFVKISSDEFAHVAS